MLNNNYKKLCESKINIDFPKDLEKIMFDKDISSKKKFIT